MRTDAALSLKRISKRRPVRAEFFGFVNIWIPALRVVDTGNAADWVVGNEVQPKVRTCDRRAPGAGHAEELHRRGATIVAPAILLPRLNSITKGSTL